MASTELTTSPLISTDVHVLDDTAGVLAMTATHSNTTVTPISVTVAPAARSVCRTRSAPPGAHHASSRDAITRASIGTAN